MESSVIQPCICTDFSESVMKDLVEKAKDWVMFHGCTMGCKQNERSPIPIMFIPSSFPRREFERAMRVHALMQKLFHDVACDYEFMSETLKNAIEVDNFTSKLFNIYRIVHEEGFAQNFTLGLMRSDYMLHDSDDNRIKQVEYNTISVSGCAFAGITSNYHKYILSELGHRDELINIPTNDPVSGFCNGLMEAWKLYNNQKAIMLFVVKETNHDIFDQRTIEFKIRELSPETKIVRRTLTDLIDQVQLGPNRELIVDDEEVAVVYYRSGFRLDAYPSEREWDVRLLLERSKAIKCSPIHYHLAGSKKVQQQLAVPGVLERFISDPDDLAMIKELFVGLYSLDMNENGDKAAAMAINEPEKYVLKPQREGGSNNLYDQELKQSLLLMKNSRDREAWILMERINSPTQNNYMIHSANDMIYEKINCTSELGIFGVILSNGREIMQNYPSGHGMRTKLSSANEVGILRGSGAMDSPYLVN